jgi:hypothetical protein
MKPSYFFLPTKAPLIVTLLLCFWVSLCFAFTKDQEISSASRIIATEPTLEVGKDGITTLTVTTLKPQRGGEFFIGIYPEMAKLPYPAYCFREKLVGVDSTTLVGKFDLKELESEDVDINGFADRHWGEFAVRFSIYSEEVQSLERKFAYVVVDSCYYRAAAMDEGPFIDCLTDAFGYLSWGFDFATACSLFVDSPAEGVAYNADRHFERPIYFGKPGTSHTYWINWYDRGIRLSTTPRQFTTAPKPSTRADFSFAVMSDTQAGFNPGDGDVEGVSYSTMRAHLDQAYDRGASLIFVTGDLVDGYTSDPIDLENQYRSWKRLAEPVASEIPIYEGMGNHDHVYHFYMAGKKRVYLPGQGSESGEAIFAKSFVNPTNGALSETENQAPMSETVYSVDWANAHFVMLNNVYFLKSSSPAVKDEPGGLGGVLPPEELDWLDKNLASARKHGIEHLFVFMHEPAFPNGGHVRDAMWWKGERKDILGMRDRFWKILCKYRVLAVFCGHEHNYSRTLIDKTVDTSFDVPIWQIVGGGGGGPFYNREMDVPWKDAVKKFVPLQHFSFVEVKGDSVYLNAITVDGTEIERVRLTP